MGLRSLRLYDPTPLQQVREPQCWAHWLSSVSGSSYHCDEELTPAGGALEAEGVLNAQGPGSGFPNLWTVDQTSTSP